MSTSNVRIAREELYEQVWETPMRALAEKYGLSDVGLAKICERFQIPRPSAGYWAQREFGKAPPRPPLQAVTDTALATVELTASPPAPPSEPAWFDARLKALADAECDRAPFVVGASLLRPHRLVVSTRAHHAAVAEYERKKKKHGEFHGHYPEPKDVLAVETTHAQFGRAIRIIDALIKAFEDRDYEVCVVHEQHRHHSRVIVEGEYFNFRLRERHRRVSHVLTVEERERVTRHPSWSWFPKHDLVPTGELEFSLQTKHGWLPTIWTDKKRRKLEDVLSVIPLWLLRQVDAERKRVADRRAEAARAEERRQEQEAAEELRRQEQARVDELIKAAHDWEFSRTLRAFLDAVRERWKSQQADHTLSEQQCGWLEWADGVADRMDPLRRRSRPSA